jgi:hypothetical protein
MPGIETRLAEKKDATRNPIRLTSPARCASTASGASARLAARAIASPISPMNTSLGMAGGSLAEGHDAHQHGIGSELVIGPSGPTSLSKDERLCGQ